MNEYHKNIISGKISLPLMSSIMDEAPFTIIAIDETGVVLFSNQRFSEITGVSSADILDRKITDIVADIFPWKSAEGFREFALRGTPWQGELEYTTAEGEKRWGYINISPVKSAEGEQRLYLITKSDITDRVAAEQALKKSENRYRSIVQNINEYIYSVEYTNGVPGMTYHSPRCYEVTGYSSIELDRDPNLWFLMIYPEDRQKVAEFLDHINTPYQMSYIEHRIVHKKGNIRWVSNSCALHRGVDGTVLRMDGFIQDITTRKDTIDQLRKLSLAIEQSPASVVITDKEGIIEYVNPKFTHLTGYLPAEVIGQNPRVLKSGYMDKKDYRKMWETILAGDEWHGEFHNKKKNGELYWEYASISPLRNSKRVTTHFIAVKEDITERKKAEEALRVSEENLRFRNQTMEDDLRYAQMVQMALLPSSPPESDTICIRYRFLPLDKLGGDYFSFIPAGKDMNVFLGDVSGHGVSAALFSSLLKFATEKIAETAGHAPAKFLQELNKALCKNMSNYFLTALYCVYTFDNEGRPLLRFANGGHPPLIILDGESGKAAMYKGKGSILGMFDDIVFAEKTVSLKKGDRIFMYTDGIPETKNTLNHIIGFDEMPEFIEKSYHADLDMMLDRILASVRAFRGDEPIEDDIVLIGCEIL